MKKITEYLIDKIVDLNIELHRLKNENLKLRNDLKAAEQNMRSAYKDVTFDKNYERR